MKFLAVEAQGVKSAARSTIVTALGCLASPLRSGSQKEVSLASSDCKSLLTTVVLEELSMHSPETALTMVATLTSFVYRARFLAGPCVKWCVCVCMTC